MQEFEKVYLEENIYCVENFMSDQEINEILSMNLEWTLIRNDMHKNIFNSWVPSGVERERFNAKVEDKIRLVVDNKNQKLRSTSLLTKYVPNNEGCLKDECRCQGYDLSWHYENHPECDYESKWITYGVVLYFNDDYEGGELVFQHKPIQIKPKKGSLMVFPASEEYSHAVKKVAGNERIVFSGFVYAKEYYDILNRSGLIEPFVF
jgi:predicted 2-oxoglutarate/Fe(II)-dependent dioxygenase YbiX